MNNSPLESIAEQLRAKGEGEDKVLAHIHPLEADLLEEMFGSSGINPETGLPQYGFGIKSITKSVKKVGKKVVGGVKKVAKGIGNVAGDIAKKTAGIPGLNAFTSQLALLDDPDDFIKIWKNNIIPQYGAGAAAGLGIMLGGNPGALTSIFGGGVPGATPTTGSGAGNSLLGLLGAGGLGALLGSQIGDDKGNSFGVQKDVLGAQEKANFTRPNMGGLNMAKLQQDASPSGQGVTSYVANNWDKFASGQYNQQQPLMAPPVGTTPATGTPPVQAARGGGLATLVSGMGTGRTDSIPAELSDGEYIMDAETVSMLGDGSNKAGAQRLDQMRQQLRQHKGAALSKGKFSPDARSPLQYLMGASK